MKKKNEMKMMKNIVSEVQTEAAFHIFNLKENIDI